MRPLFRRVLGAMLLLLVVTLGSLVLVYQNATRVNFGIYQTQHSRTVYRHIARVVARYYQQHHQSFSGVNSLVHSLSHLAPGPIQVRPLSTAPSHGPGPSPSSPHQLPITVGGKIVGHLDWQSAGRPAGPPVPPPFLQMMNRSFETIGAVALVAAFIVSYFMARGIVRPVEALTVAAERIAAGALDERVTIGRRDEIGSLGHAFNGLAAHLQTQQELREQLVDDVAHELRHPLTHLKGYLEGMIDHKIPLDQNRLMALYAETQHLNRLVDDLHRLAQAEAGTLERHPEWCGLEPLMSHVVEMLRQQWEDKPLMIKRAGMDGLPLVYVDPLRTREILDNVLRNAIQHSGQGATIWVRGRTSVQGVVVEIEDFGEGIAPSDLPHIFTRFYRADSARQRGVGGVGLGLAIAKHLMEQAGGTIEVKSQEHLGTTFILTFYAQTA